ncbi:MAG: hypothetical protein M1451_09740, partial [Acidobacteria bacterium]|nr:hypothetical protein [Acidobacteriota bacterium]
MKRTNWRDALLAVLAGNVIYFLLVEPGLPERLRHHTFQIDAGLWIDFAVCVVVLAVIRWVRKKRKMPG